jgi:heptosyltransferase-2
MEMKIQNPKSKIQIKDGAVPHTPINKILVRTPNWLGDSVMSIPTVVGIKRIFPNSEIWIWTKKGLSDLWKFVPEVKGVIDGVSKNHDFDLGVLLTNSFSSALKMYWAKIPEIRGYSINFRSILLTQPVQVKRRCKEMHQIDYFFGITQDLLGDINLGNPKIVIPSELKEKSKKNIIDSGWDGRSLLIGIHATASFGSAKRWIPERFSQLIDKLISDYSAYILMVGSESEKNDISSILKNTKNPGKIINIAGKTELEEFISAIGLCNLFIANDSGPMHIASCLGIPVVAMFGSTDPKHTGPREKNCMILYNKTKCSPCFRRICNKDLECMKLITVEDVNKAVKNFIGSGAV